MAKLIDAIAAAIGNAAGQIKDYIDQRFAASDLPIDYFNNGNLKIEHGGTEADNGADACANIGAVKKSGDTMTGALTTTWIKIAKDATPALSFTDASGQDRGGVAVQSGDNVMRFSVVEMGASYSDRYVLPSPTSGLTANKTYSILTTKPGMAIPSNADLNDYTTPGVYRSTSGTVSATLTNTPYSTTGFRMEVFNTTSENQIMQEIKCNSASARTYRRIASCTDGAWTFQNWYQVSTLTVLYSATEPEYIAGGIWLQPVEE